jgi:hypothetical protein
MTNDLRHLEEARRTAEREVPVVTFTLQRPEAELAVVGEANFQAVLERFSGGRDEDGAIFRHHAGVLMPEPYNRYDHEAISVRICDEVGETDQIGYLSHDDAVAYAPILDLVSPAIPMSLVTLEGGWDRWSTELSNFGAILNLGSPAEMAAEWYYHRRPLSTDHKWSGMTVVFVGRSLHSIGDIRLDRRSQAFLAARAGCSVEPYVGPTVQVCVTGHITGVSTELRSARRNHIQIVPEERFWQDVDCYVRGSERIDAWLPGDSPA